MGAAEPGWVRRYRKEGSCVTRRRRAKAALEWRGVASREQSVLGCEISRLRLRPEMPPVPVRYPRGEDTQRAAVLELRKLFWCLVAG